MRKDKCNAGAFVELNLDGLVGPTHCFAGLAFGNQASLLHANQVSYPRAAALQGLNKMRLLHQLGLAQGILPPPIRPNLSMLHSLGFQGSHEAILKQACNTAPALLNACYSASSMWAANAATVSSQTDTPNQKLHFTPANLISQLHRSQESAFTSKVLQMIFNHARYFVHHRPLLATTPLSDEGAANTNRLCQHHGKPGINVFVYGQTAFAPSQPRPHRYPARQTREACEANARVHGLDPQRTFFFPTTS